VGSTPAAATVLLCYAGDPGTTAAHVDAALQLFDLNRQILVVTDLQKFARMLTPDLDPVVVPLYPQSANSTTTSVLDVLPRGIPVVRGFHDHPAYIAALAASVRRHWDERGRALMLVISFHGLPQRAAP